MTVLDNSLLLGAAPGGGGGGGAGGNGYQISRSLRFNSADSAYLSRTPSVAGNRKTWTFSFWIKITDNNFATNQTVSILGANSAGHDFVTLYNRQLRVSFNTASSGDTFTNAQLRDSSAWYHVVIALDTTQATAANRLKVYLNGVEQTFSSYTAPPLNYQTTINNNTAQSIGYAPYYATYFNGYLADIHFIDGQALTPASFGEFNSVTGQWIPKAYTGTYGTNGFKLDFADNSAATAAALGKDTSGNGNNWTPNNLSVTAGAGNDSLVDTPTSYGTDTGVGGEVRGNYCTVNAVLPYTNTTLSNGNLDFVSGAIYRNVVGSVGVSSGKWYWEILVNSWSSDAGIGITNNPNNDLTGFLGSNTSAWAYSPWSSGTKYGNGTSAAYGSTYTNGDIIGVALDADNGTLAFYKNGAGQGNAFTGLAAGTYFPAFGGGNTTSMVANFGQRQWSYPAPAGFKALCDTNLPAPTIVKPSTVMDVKLYTGNGGTQTISGLGFSPDLVWGKVRSTTGDHHLVDSVRGDASGTTNKTLFTTSTEGDYPGLDRLFNFSSTGFTAGGVLNTDTATYAAWCWDAGSSTVTNTQGSITSTVRANPSAGFSIVTWPGNGSASASVGHGLGVTPQFVITKRRDSASYWLVYHVATGKDKYLWLNDASGAGDLANYWGSTGPTSTTIQLSEYQNNNGSMVAYVFAPVAGYSAFGSYTGNGSATDGPFVYAGFRPRWVMVKRTDTSGFDWIVYDSVRNTYNPATLDLAPNLPRAEVANFNVDLVSAGIKLRTDSGYLNASTATYIYAAFAEFPFQFARAR